MPEECTVVKISNLGSTAKESSSPRRQVSTRSGSNVNGAVHACTYGSRSFAAETLFSSGLLRAGSIPKGVHRSEVFDS